VHGHGRRGRLRGCAAGRVQPLAGVRHAPAAAAQGEKSAII